MQRDFLCLTFLLLLPLGVTTFILSFITLLLFSICVHPCPWKIGLHLLKGRHGLFKMRNDFSLSFVEKGETGTDVYAEVLIKNLKIPFILF